MMTVMTTDEPSSIQTRPSLLNRLKTDDDSESWNEFYRILEPGGLFCGIVPTPDSPWAWGDPSHTRIITIDQFVFLSQQAYREQVGKTAMSDFRSVYRGDFTLIHEQKTADKHQIFVLQRL